MGADGAGDPGDPVEAGDVLDLLTGLVDKSLVLAEARGAEERYRLLETLRQYAEERLLQAGEAAPLRDRHAAWCLALRARARRRGGGRGNPSRTRRAAAARRAGERARRARPGGPPTPRPPRRPRAARRCAGCGAGCGAGGRRRDHERDPPLAGDLPGAGARAHRGARPVPAHALHLPQLGAGVRPRWRRGARGAGDLRGTRR